MFFRKLAMAIMQSCNNAKEVLFAREEEIGMGGSGDRWGGRWGEVTQFLFLRISNVFGLGVRSTFFEHISVFWCRFERFVYLFSSGKQDSLLERPRRLW